MPKSRRWQLIILSAFVIFLIGCGLWIIFNVVIPIVTYFWPGAEWHRVEDEIQEFYTKVLPDTSWVEEKFSIYFYDSKRLYSVNIDGTELKCIFETSSFVRGCYFSPNGKYIAITAVGTEKHDVSVYILDRSTNQTRLLDSLSDIPEVYWAPNSRYLLCHICELIEAGHGLRNEFYIFDCLTGEKKTIAIPSTPGDISWDLESKNIYFTNFEICQDNPYRYNVELFRVPITTLKIELIDKFKYCNGYLLKRLKLEPLGIKLFNKIPSIISKTGYWDLPLTLRNGARLVLDKKNDNICYEQANGNKKVLFRIPRSAYDRSYCVDSFRGIPGGRYVIMRGPKGNIIVLEPSTGKMGKLSEGYAFGWYELY